MRNPETYIGIFGHAKYGKSTIAGRLLFELNQLSQDEISRLRIRATELGHDFNPYNLAVLKRQPKSELDLSRTTFPERATLSLSNDKVVTVIDTPGHEDFLENKIYGAYLSDIAIVAIEASKGIEAGTITIMRILEAFKIPIAAIAITKMDVVNYSQTYFEELVNEIRTKLLSMFNNFDSPIQIIPVDALSDMEVGIKSIARINWYKGKTIVEAIEGIASEFSPANETSRLIVEGRKEIYEITGVGTVIVGMLETGTLKNSDKLFLVPNAESTKEDLVYSIKSLQLAKPVNSGTENRNIEIAHARCIISILVKGETKILGKLLRSGGVFTNDKSDLPNKVSFIKAEIYFFDPQMVYVGKEYILYTNAGHTTVSILETEGDERKEVYRRSAQGFVSAIDFTIDQVRNVELGLKNPIYIESDPLFQRLTRFILKEDNKVVACGRCTEILKNVAIV